jgi:hypothetical protein
MSRENARVIGVLVTAVVLGGCGSPGVAPSASVAPTVVPTPEPTESPTPEPTPTPTPDLTAFENCQALVGPLLDKLGELDSRLDVGLNYGEYGDAVAAANVEYDRIDFDALAAEYECLSGPGVPLEDALNAYFDAYQTWDECFDKPECTNESITPELQEAWATAEGFVRDAREALSDLRP